MNKTKKPGVNLPKQEDAPIQVPKKVEEEMPVVKNTPSGPNKVQDYDILNLADSLKSKKAGLNDDVLREESNVQGFLNKSEEEQSNSQESDDQTKSEVDLRNPNNTQQKAGLGYLLGSEHNIQEFRDILMFSTPEERKQLKAIINEFEPEESSVNQTLIEVKPVELTDEEKEEKAHQERVRSYGPDYVTAKNKTGEIGYFSATTWGFMSGDKDGWKKHVAIPKEVQELNK